MSKEEYKAMQSLKNNNDIIPLPEDKGNSIVIMDNIDYVSEAEHKLNDFSAYSKSNKDPLLKHNKEF